MLLAGMGLIAISNLAVSKSGGSARGSLLRVDFNSLIEGRR